MKTTMTGETRPVNQTTGGDDVSRIIDTLQNSKDIVSSGIAVFTKIHDRISQQLDRARIAVDDIQRECAAQNISIPGIGEHIEQLNDLHVLKTKLDKYLTEIQDDNNPIEKKVAMLAVMVEITDTNKVSTDTHQKKERE